MPVASARIRRWLRPLRPGWKASDSIIAPTVRAGSAQVPVAVTADRGPALVGGGEAEHDLHGGRLPGSVRPEETGDAAGWDREAEIIDHGVIAVALGDVVDLHGVRLSGGMCRDAGSGFWGCGDCCHRCCLTELESRLVSGRWSRERRWFRRVGCGVDVHLGDGGEPRALDEPDYSDEPGEHR